MCGSCIVVSENDWNEMKLFLKSGRDEIKSFMKSGRDEMKLLLKSGRNEIKLFLKNGRNEDVCVKGEQDYGKIKL